jgi:hypothetical protein
MLVSSLSNNSLFFEILSSELKKFLIEVPYNSVSQFYEVLDKRRVDDRFGLSCVWQAYALGARLKDKGICDVSYYVDGRHVALICHADDEQYLIDPYLLHTVPIDISMFYSKNVDDSSGVVSAERVIKRESYAYPYRKLGDSGYRPAKLVTKFYPDRRELCLTYKKYSLSRGHYIISRAFTMDLDRAIATTPPDDAVVRLHLFHGEQNNLSIRIVHRKNHCMYELIYPIALYHRAPVDERHLIARDNNGKMIMADNLEAFRFVVNKMSESLCCSVTVLQSFVLEGVAIYEKYAPSTIDYSTFQLKDE